jgi:hypothetical protein
MTNKNPSLENTKQNPIKTLQKKLANTKNHKHTNLCVLEFQISKKWFEITQLGIIFLQKNILYLIHAYICSR